MAEPEYVKGMLTINPAVRDKLLLDYEAKLASKDKRIKELESEKTDHSLCNDRVEGLKDEVDALKAKITQVERILKSMSYEGGYKTAIEDAISGR